MAYFAQYLGFGLFRMIIGEATGEDQACYDANE